MALRAVQHYNVSIRLACTVFSISQSCYYYQPKHAQENAIIADWLIRLATAQRNWGLGLCFAYWLAQNLFENLEEVQQGATAWLWIYNNAPQPSVGWYHPKTKTTSTISLTLL